jgi:hypothetical protein
MGAVVVNEFEVVAQPPAAAQQDAASAQRAPQGPPPELLREIERTVRRLRERAARLEAD